MFKSDNPCEKHFAVVSPTGAIMSKPYPAFGLQ